MLRMHLEMRHLRLAATVAEAGSLTRAGERFHLDDRALIAIPLTSRGFPRRWYAATLRARPSRYLDDFDKLLARGTGRRRSPARIAS